METQMSIPPQAITTAAHLDLDRYLGTWFEICRLPLKWEDAHASDITATYSLDPDGSIKVDNRCIDEEGKPDQAIGQAFPTDAGNARLKVSFLPQYLRWLPFTKGDYWVMRISPDYTVALVGTPDRSNLWLLSRTPQLPGEVCEDYLSSARAEGFDLAALITPLQSGNIVSDTEIAAAQADSRCLLERSPPLPK
jgi:apolipoprotein D and lipocalin family protein